MKSKYDQSPDAIQRACFSVILILLFQANFKPEMYRIKTIYIINSIMYFELDNDDMESSKRRSLFISLIFILKKLH